MEIKVAALQHTEHGTDAQYVMLYCQMLCRNVKKIMAKNSD